jgi:branched-chain amino acid aminotransferase
MAAIRVEITKSPKAKPADESKLGFGRIFTDHMFIMNYDCGEGWHDGRIVPYAPLSLDPSAMILHYAQGVFEGLKAYRTADDRILLFRPEENFKRMNLSNERLCIPEIDEKFALEALMQLIELDRDWVPSLEGASLYIRPFIIATDSHIGVHPADHFYFIIILSPVGAYYPEGLNPVKIYVEKNYVRSVKGGMGFAKTAGNYAVSLKAQHEAENIHYTQVLWLDGVERKYIEEVGTMNVFFKINGEVITPELHGSILSGITRKSAIDLLRSWGITVAERRISIEEIAKAADNGTLEEIFGTGTAAVISPIGELKWGDKVITIGEGKIGPVSQRLYDTLTGIQRGKLSDGFGWMRELK